jgi:hypothetical protein
LSAKETYNDIGSVVGYPRIDDPLFCCTGYKLVGFIVVLPVPLRQLEPRALLHRRFPFPFVELTDPPCPILAVVVAAPVVTRLSLLLPGKQGVKAIGTPVLGLSLKASPCLEEFMTDLAQKLASL